MQAQVRLVSLHSGRTMVLTVFARTSFMTKKSEGPSISPLGELTRYVAGQTNPASIGISSKIPARKGKYSWMVEEGVCKWAVPVLIPFQTRYDPLAPSRGDFVYTAQLDFHAQDKRHRQKDIRHIKSEIYGQSREKCYILLKVFELFYSINNICIIQT